MIPAATLRRLARARLADARVLFANRRYDATVYLCGYTVAMALKARICRTLGWPGFPETRAEFQDYTSFRTHSLRTLLRLSGREKRILARYPAEWAVVAAWDPELRYSPPGIT